MRLEQTSRYLWNGALELRLFEVQPVVHKGFFARQERGLDVRSPQRRNEMAGFVTGTPMADVDSYRALVLIAAAIDEATAEGWSDRSGSRGHRSPRLPQIPA